ncbi:antitoxin [Zoogloea sp.]|uniref:antitoxin n=1 Tax=Zoogloea sp. TaxID=49181 RepID=UPI002638D5C6|nr:AbrB/MazE/SpoVT family DNA-binding domain-containing protein [uncultured Zoogloea sp.]
MKTLTTQVLNNDNSQMVLIPPEFRLDADSVRIARNEAGDLVIHARRVPRGEVLLQALKALGEVDDAFVVALGADQQGVLPMQEREAL